MKFIFFMYFFAVSVMANTHNVELLGLELSQTRVVINGNSGGSIEVSNKKTIPLIAKFDIMSADMKDTSDFFVAPPIVRIEGGESISVLISNKSSKPLSEESMYWFCAKAIEPVDSTASASGFSAKIKITASNCVKLFYRSSLMRAKWADEQKLIIWQKRGEELIAVNRSPFYFVIPAGSVLKKFIILPPNSTTSADVDRKLSSGQTIEWGFIDDYGAEIKVSSQIR